MVQLAIWIVSAVVVGWFIFFILSMIAEWFEMSKWEIPENKKPSPPKL
jgi:hypothetical protein